MKLTTTQKIKKAILDVNGHDRVSITAFRTAYSKRLGKLAIIYYTVNDIVHKLELTQAHYYDVTEKLI